MRNAMKILLPLAALAVVTAGLGLWWFFAGDAPAPVSLETATQGSAETTETVALGSVDGIWLVDTATGTFDYESATGSFVGFRIEEELSGIGSTTAVGRTGDVTGTVTIEGTTVTATAVDVDLLTITTDDSRRDDNVQDLLETSAFPTATFVLSEPIQLGGDAAEGDPVSTNAAGELTIHGVTQPIDMAIDAQLVGDTVVLVGSTTVTFADFDVTVPESGPVLSVDDNGILELQLLLNRR